MSAAAQSDTTMAPATDYSAIYTVILRGEEFELTHDQLLRDSPNFFTGCFLNDFREAGSRVVRLSRNPALFRILLEYMSGYDVLPLNPATLPEHMSLEGATKNLLADCEFYGFDELAARLKDIIAPLGPIDLVEHGYHPGPPVPFERVLDGKLPPGVVYCERGRLCGIDDKGVQRLAVVQCKNIPISVRFRWRWDVDDKTWTGSVEHHLVFGTSTFAKIKAHTPGFYTTGFSYIGAITERHISLSLNGTETSFADLRLWLNSFGPRSNHAPGDIHTRRFDIFDRVLPFIVPDLSRQNEDNWPRTGPHELEVTLHASKILFTLSPAPSVEQGNRVLAPLVLDIQAHTMSHVHAALRRSYDDSLA